jgi:SAM-dependent methyltransferase
MGRAAKPGASLAVGPGPSFTDDSGSGALPPPVAWRLVADDSWDGENLAWWEERVELHLGSDLYDLPAFRAGRSSLFPYELEELGGVEGKDLLHLQCHVGLDTISWGRLGARVTGLDYSPTAVAAARRLAEEEGLSAEFLVASVAEAPTVLNRQFDIVYTGKGALGWLPDLRNWAGVVNRTLRPGGLLYLVESHPIIDCMGETPTFELDYVDPEEVVWDEPGDYAVPDAATKSNRTHEMLHPLGDVVTCLAEEGMAVRLLHERSEIFFARFPGLVAAGPGVWRPPTGWPRLPLSYSLLAQKG